MLRRLFLIGLALILLVASMPKVADARQGVHIIEFTMSHKGEIVHGTHVQLYILASGGTVRFEITNNDTGQVWYKAEIGAPEQWETWKTEEMPPGHYLVCGAARGNGGWENADRSCEGVYVAGGQGAPGGSEPGDDVKCWVSSFTVSPSQGQVGSSFQFSASGQCDGNLRSMRFSINGNPFGEFAGPSHATSWSSSGYSTGSYSACAHFTAGEWSDAATSCVTITLTSSQPDPGDPPPPPAQGDPADNGQPGQTADSGPGPAPAQPPSGGSGSSGSSGSNDSGSGGGSPNGVCPNAPARLEPGVLALANDALNVRSGPGTSNQVQRQLSYGSLVSVISGPVCNGGWRWWEIGDSGWSGWSAEVGSDGVYLLVPNGFPLGADANSWGGPSYGQAPSDVPQPATAQPNPTQAPAAVSPPSSDSVYVPANLTVGGYAKIIFSPDFDPLNLRTGPGLGYGVIRDLGEGEVGFIVDGPNHSNGYTWYNLVFPSGETGWTAVASLDGDPWVQGLRMLEAVATIVEVSFFYAPFQTQYTFVVDTQSCAIVNGAEIVAQEINRAHNWSDSLYSNKLPQQALLLLANYLRNNGGIDTFRTAASSQIDTATNCKNPYYQLSQSNHMDMYGLGNVVYGYFSSPFLNSWFTHRFADAIQLLEEGRLDPPDDRSQADLGRAIATSGQYPTESLIISLIPGDFVNSR